MKPYVELDSQQVFSVTGTQRGLSYSLAQISMVSYCFSSEFTFFNWEASAKD